MTEAFPQLIQVYPLPRPIVGVSFLMAELNRPAASRGACYAIDTLLASDLPERAVLQIVALDNGSEPGWWRDQALRRVREVATVWEQETNVGIAAGRNVIARTLFDDIQPDYVLELHTDHLFPRLWAKPLLEAMAADDQLGAVGPALLTQEGVFGSPRFAFDYEVAGYDVEETQDEVSQAARRASFRYSGARPRLRRGLSHPVLKRVAAMQAAGLFYDEDRYPMQNFEDTDEVRRLERAGFHVCISLDSWVYHHYNLTRSRIGDVYWTYRQNRKAFREVWPDADAWLVAWDRDLHRVYDPGVFVEALEAFKLEMDPPR